MYAVLSAVSIKRSLSLLLLFLIFAGCAPTGGVFGSGSWQASDLQGQHIRALTVNPKNLKEIYAGNTSGSLMVSSDAGGHWRQRSVLPSANAINVLAFAVSGKKLYAASVHGLFVSEDGGQQWANLLAQMMPTANFVGLAFDLNRPEILYVATLQQGIFASTDGGATWFAINTGLPQNVTVHSLTYATEQHQLWIATSSGIYRSDDSGATWRAFNSGLPVGLAMNVVEIAASSGGAQGLIYAGSEHGFFRSLDGGQHWSASQDSLAGTSIYALQVDFRISNTTTVYAGTGVGALRSDDNGQTWRSVASGLPRAEVVHAIVIGADNYAQIYATANDVYLYPGNDGGFNLNRFWPLLLILAFFSLLYWLTRRRSRRRLSD